jgi:deoxyribodipyrimidine photo-lyase
VTVAVVVFTRDLRVRDNPVLHAAVGSADHVVPLFVLDDGIARLAFNRPNRAHFLADSLADLDRSLRHRGGRLVIRRGEVAREVAAVADLVDAAVVHIGADYSRYAVARERRIQEAIGRRGLIVHDTHVIAPPGEVVTTAGAPFSIFTPYYRRWLQYRPRTVVPAPRSIVVPRRVASGRLPTASEICAGTRSPDLLEGGETAARAKARRWFQHDLAGYDRDHDLVAADGTSRLSPYLHFGCISPVELAARAEDRQSGSVAFLRQLAWRDFFLQALAARPQVADEDWRSCGDVWRQDDAAYQAWVAGRTGYPLVDAGMRQLTREGWMHNRARLVAGSFLTKHLYLDWRLGARHFFDLLVDGDLANNALNWQWVAGTGTDSRPNRILNPTLQLRRYDPELAYVRRYVEEYGTAGYPSPIVDHAAAVAAFRAARGRP